MSETKYFQTEDTIVAIATAQNAMSAVGIVRLSGANVLQTVSPVLKTKSTKIHKDGKLQADKIKSHYLYRCLVLDEVGKEIDDAMFVYMKAPNSYTGENSVEIHMHGNPLLLNKAIKALVLKGGARHAEPGEFSFRAFHNGKMDLSQAEAVSDLISGQSGRAMHLALGGILGNMKSFVDATKADLVKLLAQVELEIDFSDQGVGGLDYQEFRLALEKWSQEIERARESYKRGMPLRNGIRTALVGAPNSGKSTLFNLLLGENRSIVSNVEGTTRDVVRESFRLGDLLLLLSDTAGIRQTKDQIEGEGIDRSYGELQDANLVLVLIDGTNEAQYAETALLNTFDEFQSLNKQAKILFVLNKTDCLRPERLAKVEANFAKDHSYICLSAKTGDGLKSLEKEIIELFSNTQMEGESFEIAKLRHYELLGKATNCIQSTIVKISEGEEAPDLIAADLRTALDFLGEINGEVSRDDLLNFIFSEFCIGK